MSTIRSDDYQEHMDDVLALLVSKEVSVFDGLMILLNLVRGLCLHNQYDTAKLLENFADNCRREDSKGGAHEKTYN